jgi:hypothetical protein
VVPVRMQGWRERRGMSSGASSAMATMVAVWAGDGGPWRLFHVVFSRQPSLHPVSGLSRADHRYHLQLGRARCRPNVIFFLIMCQSIPPPPHSSSPCRIVGLTPSFRVAVPMPATSSRATSRAPPLPEPPARAMGVAQEEEEQWIPCAQRGREG